MSAPSKKFTEDFKIILCIARTIGLDGITDQEKVGIIRNLLYLYSEADLTQHLKFISRSEKEPGND
jgi:hypothetical protein